MYDIFFRNKVLFEYSQYSSFGTSVSEQLQISIYDFSNSLIFIF